MKPEFIDGWSSHQYPLVTAAMNTTGPIVEFGCGNYSTPLLSAIARAQGRTFEVFTSNADWADSFRDLAKINIIEPADWIKQQYHYRAGLLFVDSEQAVKDRSPTVIRHKELADVIVMHDAQVMRKRQNSWQPFADNFEYDFEWTRLKPKATTAVFSNAINVYNWF